MSGWRRARVSPRGSGWPAGEREEQGKLHVPSPCPLSALPRLGAQTLGSLVLKNHCGKGNGPFNPTVPGTVLERRNSKINKTQSPLPSAGQADKQCVACEHRVWP